MPPSVVTVAESPLAQVNTCLNLTCINGGGSQKEPPPLMADKSPDRVNKSTLHIESSCEISDPKQRLFSFSPLSFLLRYQSCSSSHVL